MNTLGDLVIEICGPLSSEDMGRVLWGASSYPFGDTESIRETLTISWANGGQTVDGAIAWSANELDRAWEAGRAERDRVIG